MTATITWDWKEQLPLDELADVLARHGVTLRQVDTGSDQYEIQISGPEQPTVGGPDHDGLTGQPLPGLTDQERAAALAEVEPADDEPGFVDRRAWTRQQWLDDARAIFNSVHGGAVDLLNGHIMALFGELHDVIQQRDLAIAHDRQPYPTAAAYQAVCATLETKRAELERLRQELTDERRRHSRYQTAWSECEDKLRAELEQVTAERNLGPDSDPGPRILALTRALDDVTEDRDAKEHLLRKACDDRDAHMRLSEIQSVELATARRDAGADVLRNMVERGRGAGGMGWRDLALFGDLIADGRLVVCCDLHGPNCEPPSELCCEGCTEVRHPEHPGGVVCVLAPLVRGDLGQGDEGADDAQG
ncbi:MAG TPA: hypothetical protein VGW74_14725 [Propionibacteriaceae bacterium]|nr:hypothetical protein [Propionibacteriaceae bacterium]